MHVVAITELRASDNAALGGLATELGTTLYELRLLLNAGLPAVVLATVEEDKAAAALSCVRRHGHRAIGLDRREVTPNASMTALRDFRFDPEGLAPAMTSSELLPYSDVLAILRATHRTTVETKKEIKERKLRPGMAIATGGLVMTKTTKREVTSKTEERQQVVYLFRASAAPPWIFREHEARYGGLGADLRPTSLENFATTIRRLRSHAPQAVYDERLVNARPVRGVADGLDAADLLAHLIAADIRQLASR